MSEITLLNGEKFEASLTYRKLYVLQCKRPKDYEEYNKVSMNGTQTELDYLRLLYTAYLCNSCNSEVLSFDEFLDNLEFNRNNLRIAGQMLSAPKKTSGNHSTE